MVLGTLRIAAGTVVAVMLATAFGVHAQDYPSRPVKIIVPFPAGGTADVMPRIFSDWLSRKWGQPVVVENRTGAAGNIGAEAVAKAEPDGYTLLSAPPPPLVINRLLYQKLPYDSAQFVPITVIGAIPNVLLVHPKTNVSTVEQFIALAKANPGKLNYASQGSGTTSHLTAELFKSMAGGLNITHVPYKGTAPALADLLGGQVEMMCDNLGVSLPHVRSGKLKALGIGGFKRIPALPEVPTFAEAGLPGAEANNWWGIVAPAGLPAPVMGRLQQEIGAILDSPETRKRFELEGAEVLRMTAPEFAQFMAEETAKWTRVVKQAGIKAE
jgi:tripartite-type tricarboxylate transporter receptor subunit TctC